MGDGLEFGNLPVKLFYTQVAYQYYNRIDQNRSTVLIHKDLKCMFTKRGVFYKPIGRGYLLFLVQLCTHTLVCKARRMDDFLKKKKNLKSVKLNWIQWHRFDSFKVGWDRISEPNCLRIEVLMIIEPLLSRRFIDAFVVSEWVNKECIAQPRKRDHY